MTIAHRVARRFVASLSPKEMLQTFTQYQHRLVPMLRDETKAPEAKQLYLDLLAAIKPVATALDNTIIQRPDEARKFKNLKVLLKHIKWRTRENPFADSEGPDDDLRIISIEMDDLGAIQLLQTSYP